MKNILQIFIMYFLNTNTSIFFNFTNLIALYILNYIPIKLRVIHVNLRRKFGHTTRIIIYYKTKQITI